MRLEEARAGLSSEQRRRLVLDIAKEDLIGDLMRYVSAHRREITAALDTWWDKYRETLRFIEGERDAAKTQLGDFLRELSYEV